MKSVRNYLIVAFFLASVATYIISCSNLKEGALNPNPVMAGVHPEGWMNQASGGFHGVAVENSNWDFDQCKECHGADYLGGTSKIACLSSGCHTQFELHPDGWGSSGSTNFHASMIVANNYWDITLCKRCHGSDYAGGTLKKSCLTCHSGAKGPEECNTCHGSSNNVAPPRALNHETATKYRGVGAHQIHLTGSDISVAIRCTECHAVPAVMSAPGHLGTLPAEVVFKDSLANTRTKGVDIVANPPKLNTSNPDSIRCDNTYCHGYFTNGNKFSPKWTKVDGTQAACGTCHDLPPPPPHPDVAVCNLACHQDVVTKVNGVIVIKDKTKHMNGKLNVFLQEQGF